MNKAKYQPNTFVININKLPYDVKLKHSYWTDYNGQVKQMPDIIEGGRGTYRKCHSRCVLLFDVNIPAVLWLCFPIIGTWTGSEDKPESFDRGFQRLCRRLNWKSKDIS